MNKLKIIDLFAGCGGLSLGFKKSNYETLAHLEIDSSCCKTLLANVPKSQLVFQEDITAPEKYIRNFLSLGKVDGVIGGPPCQAYSIAGRNKKENNMDTDPRNYLFESFVFNLRKLKPKFFVFENVTGMLSARPFGLDISEEIKKAFEKSHYSIMSNFKDCVFDMSDYGIPQRRKRIILFGVNKKYRKDSAKIVQEFYSQMHENKIKPQRTVRDVISDLPVLNDANPTSNDKEHYLRFRNERDKSIFKLLTEDIFNGKNIYKSTDSLKKLYYEITNRHTSVHKYHVLKWDEPSNTIPAHIYKDGLRHIHPDPNQSRTISIREVMRLMTFPDNYKLEGSNGDKYKMLGNAVPPQFSFIVANTIEKILEN